MNEPISAQRTRWKGLLRDLGATADSYRRVYLQPSTGYTRKFVTNEKTGELSEKLTRAPDYSFAKYYSYKEPQPEKKEFDITDLTDMTRKIKTTDKKESGRNAEDAVDSVTGAGWVPGQEEYKRKKQMGGIGGEELAPEELLVAKQTVRDTIEEELRKYKKQGGILLKKRPVLRGKPYLERDIQSRKEWDAAKVARDDLLIEYMRIEGNLSGEGGHGTYAKQYKDKIDYTHGIKHLLLKGETKHQVVVKMRKKHFTLSAKQRAQQRRKKTMRGTSPWSIAR